MTLSFSEHKMLQEVLETVREIKEAVGCDYGEKKNEKHPDKVRYK